MSDVELMVRERLIKKMTDVFMERYSAGYLSTVWGVTIDCEICPYFDKCDITNENLTNDTCPSNILRLITNEVVAEHFDKE